MYHVPLKLHEYVPVQSDGLCKIFYLDFILFIYVYNRYSVTHYVNRGVLQLVINAYT